MAQDMYFIGVFVLRLGRMSRMMKIIRLKYFYLLIIGEDCPDPNQPRQTERASVKKQEEDKDISLK